jgi:hypothetical protein
MYVIIKQIMNLVNEVEYTCAVNVNTYVYFTYVMYLLIENELFSEFY